MRRGSCAYFGGGPKLECYGTELKRNKVNSKRNSLYFVIMFDFMRNKSDFIVKQVASNVHDSTNQVSSVGLVTTSTE